MDWSDGEILKEANTKLEEKAPKNTAASQKNTFFLVRKMSLN